MDKVCHPPRAGFRHVGALGHTRLWGPPRKNFSGGHSTQDDMTTFFLFFYQLFATFWGLKFIFTLREKKVWGPEKLSVGAPQMWGPWGTCPICPMVNPALFTSVEDDAKRVKIDQEITELQSNIKCPVFNGPPCICIHVDQVCS